MLLPLFFDVATLVCLVLSLVCYVTSKDIAILPFSKTYYSENELGIGISQIQTCVTL